MFCPNCGNQMSNDAKFCKECGWHRSEINNKKGTNFNMPIILITSIIKGIIIILIIGIVVNFIIGRVNYKKSKDIYRTGIETTASGKIVYNKGNNIYAKNEIVKEGSDLYYFNSNEEMVKNDWVECDGKWYYCESDGKIAKSKWVENTYYVDENGQMLKNTFTPDGYYVGNDGKYVDSNNQNVSSYENVTVDSFVNQLKGIINEQPTYIDIANKYVAWELNRDPYNSKDEIIEYWKEYFYLSGFALSDDYTPIKISESDYYVLSFFSPDSFYPFVISIESDNKKSINVRFRNVEKKDKISKEQIKTCIEKSQQSDISITNYMYYKQASSILTNDELVRFIENKKRIKNFQNLILQLKDDEFEKFIRVGAVCAMWDDKIEQIGGCSWQQKYFNEEPSLQFIYDEVNKCWKWIPDNVDQLGDWPST